MSRFPKQERVEAVGRLKKLVKPGDTVYTTLRSVSRSGMSRVVDLHVIGPDGQLDWIGGMAARAIDMTYDQNRRGLKVGGCGFDAGFEVVYNLGRALWPDGAVCIGDKCRSNDHSNGDRDYTPHLHRDGGYSLKHEWI